MADLILFWHRRDLRVSDNIGLASARQVSPKVVGVFCLDPLILQRDDVAPARVTYMMGSLQELQRRYTQVGSHLLILQDDPTVAIPRLAQALEATALYFNLDVEPYARQRDRTIKHALEAQGIAVRTYWDQLLHTPKEIMTGAGSPYTVYTPFWRNWNQKSKLAPVADLEQAEGLTAAEQQRAVAAGVQPLPQARDLGFRWDHPLILEPGEQAAAERLEAFCDRQRTIDEYREQRNFPATAGTSQLSAALKFGTVGVRTVWAATQQAMERSRSDDTQDNIQTWQQELAWREFYQHALFHFPELAEGAYREHFKDFPWDSNQERFQAWCEGQTGYPIVDAAMRQMNQLGWMHNRCRMIVASFLTKDLMIDFRWGEKYFMQQLVDGDLSANNGGWQWSASSGMDPKPLRIFNPASQAKKFDPDGEYIRAWLPELRHLDTALLVTGEISEGDRHRCGYPLPVVDHKQQQQVFKQRYADQKRRSSHQGRPAT